jgi:putative nucleotidyltransferase with HDIG domain
MGHVLVVDDHETVRETLQAQLAMFRHSSDGARDALEGIRRVEERDYDLVISDVKMPSMTGIEFLRRIQPRVHRRTPCIIMTAWAEMHLAVQAMRVGACNFLTKPWEMPELEEAVSRAMDLRNDYILRINYEIELERELEKARDELRRTYDGTVSGIAAMLEGKDPSTMSHCLRVADYCTMLAREMAVPEDEIPDIRLGAMLHDVGKYRVPDAILLKPGPLTPEEWVEMRRHPEYGADFVRRIPFLQGAGAIVANHHERYDGGGYPRGLAGANIPLAARIFSIVDAFDAIVSKRCYKGERSPDVALHEIRRCSGSQFDPIVVEAFERVLPKILNAQTPGRIGDTRIEVRPSMRPAAR